MKKMYFSIHRCLDEYNEEVFEISSDEAKKEDYKKLWKAAQDALFKIADKINYRW